MLAVVAYLFAANLVGVNGIQGKPVTTGWVNGPDIRTAIVQIEAEPIPVLRRRESPGEMEPVVCLNASVIHPPASPNGGILNFVGSAPAIDPYRALRGLYVVAYYECPKLNGPKNTFWTESGDAALMFAIPVSPAFNYLTAEPAKVTVYRALFALVSSPMVLQEVIRTKMPRLRDHDADGYLSDSPLEHFSPDARMVANMVEAMGNPLRRVVLYGRLLEEHFCEAEEPMERAIWACRDNLEIEELDLPRRLTIGRSRSATAFWVDSRKFLEKAEQSSVDKVRAFYLQTIDKAFDKPRMARLLLNSGKQSKLAICRQLQRGGDVWRITELAPEEQERRLEEFVAHWKEVYRVGS